MNNFSVICETSFLNARNFIEIKFSLTIIDLICLPIVLFNRNEDFYEN